MNYIMIAQPNWKSFRFTHWIDWCEFGVLLHFIFLGWLQSVTMQLYYKIYDDSNAARRAKIIAQPFRSDSMKSFYPVYHRNAVNSLTFPTYQIIYIIWNNHSFIHIVFSNDLSDHPLRWLITLLSNTSEAVYWSRLRWSVPKWSFQPVDLISFMVIHSCLWSNALNYLIAWSFRWSSEKIPKITVYVGRWNKFWILKKCFFSFCKFNKSCFAHMQN